MNYWWTTGWRLYKIKRKSGQQWWREVTEGEEDRMKVPEVQVSRQHSFFPPIVFPPFHSHGTAPCHAPAPPSPTVLLCCQITKWLFACYKQRKQILYRYYIYIEMFCPCWDVCIGTDITLIHTLRQYSFNSPTILHTFTYMYTVANSNLWEKVTETHFLSCWKWIYSTRYTSWYCLLLWNPSFLSVF